MTPHSPLDDPHVAAHAWRRYKRLMCWMALVTTITVIVALGAIYAQEGMVSIHFYIASALGVGLAMMLMSALMGLVFLSNATGHDDAIADPLKGEEDRR